MMATFTRSFLLRFPECILAKNVKHTCTHTHTHTCVLSAQACACDDDGMYDHVPESTGLPGQVQA